jgi:hypothetical protein
LKIQTGYAECPIRGKRKCEHCCIVERRITWTSPKYLDEIEKNELIRNAKDWLRRVLGLAYIHL